MAAPTLALRRRLGGLAALDDAELALGETALLLAALGRGDAGRAIDDAVALLTQWTAELIEDGAVDAEARAAALVRVLVDRHRFHADPRDDELDNADLLWVLEHRRGTADALGLVWLEVARRAGWVAEGLAFPTHFLVRLEDAHGHRVIVDPYGGGAPVDPPALRALLKAGSGLAAELEPGLFTPLDNRDILLRLHNDLKLRLLRGGELARALAVVENLLLVAPDRPLLWREAGLMHMRLDNLPAAVAALEQFVARTGNGTAKRRTQQLLQEIRGRMQ